MRGAGRTACASGFAAGVAIARGTAGRTIGVTRAAGCTTGVTGVPDVPGSTGDTATPAVATEVGAGATASGGGVGCATRMGAAIRMGSRMPMIGRMGGPGGGGGGGVGENVVTPWARGIEAILTPRIRDAIGLGR